MKPTAPLQWRTELKRYVSTAPYILPSILILAALLRLLQLGSESLWYDEAVTVAIVRLDWEAFWKVLSHFEANMGLYYCLLRLWVNLGESEFVLRSLSALTGVLAVWAWCMCLGNGCLTQRWVLWGLRSSRQTPFISNIHRKPEDIV